jgi:L-ascorbate metabolism protein UlaG (beta-lactamase superfamily)
MQISWHGYSSVRIESKNNAKDTCTLVTDPFENEASIRFPRTLDPDVVVLSHQDRKRFNLAAFQGSPFVISEPGEYEVRGVFIYGIQDPNADEGTERPIIYRISTEGMNLAFLDGINRKLTNVELEQLENIDVLLLPVGGGDVLDADKAVDVISEVEPRVVVPLSYAVPGLKKKLGSVDAFCKHLGGGECQKMTKLKIQRKDLPADSLLVAVLERA